MRDHTAGTYYRAVANGDPGTDGDIAAKPTVIAYPDGESRLKGLAALEIVDGMLGSVERTVGTYERMRTDGDVARVEKHAIIIYKHPLAEVQAIAMVAMKGRKDGDRLGYTGNHRLEH